MNGEGSACCTSHHFSAATLLFKRKVITYEIDRLLVYRYALNLNIEPLFDKREESCSEFTTSADFRGGCSLGHRITFVLG